VCLPLMGRFYPRISDRSNFDARAPSMAEASPEELRVRVRAT
jgi:hypothetical protein